MVEYDPAHIEDSIAFGAVPAQMSRPCGWCGQPAWMRRRAAIQAGSILFDPRHISPLVYGVYECSGCNRASMGIFIMTETGSGWQADGPKDFFPSAQAKPLGISNPEVEADRLEAWACYYVGQMRASVLMARAALQRAVRSLDTSFRAKLPAELDNLVATGVITKQLRANADEVRLSGNDAAHPEELGAVAQEDALDSLTFLDDFIETTLVIPERQREREKERRIREDQ